LIACNESGDTPAAPTRPEDSPTSGIEFLWRLLKDPEAQRGFRFVSRTIAPYVFVPLAALVVIVVVVSVLGESSVPTHLKPVVAAVSALCVAIGGVIKLLHMKRRKRLPSVRQTLTG
jgi:hypothetical protein